MANVPHVLSPADSAAAQAIATQVHACADPLNRQILARYGMDIFQQIQSKPTLTQDAIYILYHIREFMYYVTPYFDDYSRLIAFERAVALNTHLLCTRQPLPVVEALEV